MLKILRSIENFLDSLERLILNRRHRHLAPLSVNDLKRMAEISEILEKNSSAIQLYYSELSRILKTAYNLKSDEMSS